MKKLLLAATAFVLATSGAYADGDNKVGKSAKIKKEEAEAIALKEVPGKVLDSDIEKRKGSLYWYIDVKPSDSSATKKQVRIDAMSGKVIAVKVDNDKDD